MKKVLVYGISNKVGGIEAVMLGYASHSDQTDLRFDILTYYDEIAYQKEFEDLGCKIYKITSKRENPIKNRLEFHRFFKRHANEYDAVWCNLAELINIDILKLAKKYGIPRRIIHSHSTTTTRGKMLTRLHYMNRKKIARVATDFWACSYDAGKWFYSDEILNGGRFHVIRNAIDLPKYLYSPEAREELRRQFDLGGKFVVGHVGRLENRQKNTLFLLDIFAQIHKKEPDSVLMLVGDGSDRPAVEQKIAELRLQNAVLLMGTRKDVPRLLSAMDVFVLPSSFEGFGMVLIEAQAAGLFSFTSADVVPKETAVTSLLEFVPLQSGAEHWAERILSVRGAERVDTSADIIKAGFDINSEAGEIRKLLEQKR